MSAIRPVLPAALAVALLATAPLAGGTARAQDFSAGNISKAYPFKDLPGVKDGGLPNPPPPSQSADDSDQPDCTRDLDLRGIYSVGPLDRRAPTVVYRCEQNGVTIESEREPLPKSFNPLTLR